jgi:hypothetical protein
MHIYGAVIPTEKEDSGAIFVSIERPATLAAVPRRHYEFIAQGWQTGDE